MAQIFISYSRKDTEFAKQLSQSLSNEGFTVWIDLVGISAGSKWSQAIQEALDETSIMIVIISPESMASPNVTDEWQYYLDQKKSVIPVLLEPAKIHFQLNRIQYIDFHNKSYNIAFEQLTHEIYLKPGNVQHLPSPLNTHTKPDNIGTRKRNIKSNVLLGSVLLVTIIVVLMYRSYITEEQNLTSTSQLDITLTSNPILSNEGGNQLPTDSGTSYICPSFTLVPPPTGTIPFQIRVKVSLASLRCAPVGYYPHITKAVQGEIYDVLAQEPGFGTDGKSVTWYLITSQYGQRLWISSEAVEIVAPKAGTSTPRPPPTLPGGGCVDNCG